MTRGAEPEPDDQSLVGQVIAGRYRVESLLGSGGMGAVYRAEHVHMRKPVAVKVLHRILTALPEVVARFEREAIAAGRIAHPNVTQGTDFGRLEDGSFYLVLEYVEGESLSHRLRGGPLPLRRALRVVRQVVSALEAAHAAGVVHRDLKPDNVMLVGLDGDADFVKVLDFGIAKVTAADGPVLTQLGTVFGTPEYMAPEQARGAAVDHRADLYSVGMILYELLAGRSAFAGDDVVQVLTRQISEPPPALPEAVPEPVAHLVMELLAKDPAARVPSAEELGRRLDAILASLETTVAEAPSASPPPVTLSAEAATSSPGASADAIAHSRTLVALEGRGLAVAARSPGFLSRKVALGSRHVPVGALVAAAAVVLFAGLGVVVVVGTASLRAASRVAAAAASLAPSSPDRSEQAVLDLASAGDADALAELSSKPESALTAREWEALGRGRARQGDWVGAVQAFRAAVDAGAPLGTAAREDLALALGEPVAAPAAVAVATRLGPEGADLLWKVANDSERPEAKKAAAAALDTEPVRAAASESLRVALDLRAARSCTSFKAVLPRAREHADARSLRWLKALRATRGCGFLRRGDCWACLRGNDDLAKALERAQGKAQDSP